MNGSAIASSGLTDHFLDVADPTVSFSESSYSVSEGEDRDITVRLSHRTAHRLRIPVSVTRDTADIGDYTVSDLANGRLTFEPHDTSESFTIETNEDSDDDDETVSLRLGSPPSHVSRGSPSSATLTIRDDDDDDPSPTNRPPSFNEGTTTTRSVRENTRRGTNIGSPISASDSDNDSLTYALGGTDAASFGISTSTGQLRTSAALNFEAKSGYSVSVSVNDGNGGSDSIGVTITVTDVNEPPRVVSAIAGRTMTAGASTTISLSGRFSDPDGDSLRYTARRIRCSHQHADTITEALYAAPIPLKHQTLLCARRRHFPLGVRAGLDSLLRWLLLRYGSGRENGAARGSWTVRLHVILPRSSLAGGAGRGG